MMASSSVKGLTIEIGADTQKFSTAMKSLDTEARTISKDLKTVSENLKLDPKSVSTAADKLKLLQEQAANAGKKVETIAAAIEKFKATRADTTSDDYRKSLEGLERQLESAKREQELANAQVEAFQKASEDAGSGASRLGDIIKGNLISEAIKNGLSGLANLLKSVASFAINAAKRVGEYAKAAVEMAAEWQDALGYSEQVFGSYSETVQKWVEENSLSLRVGETALIQYVNKFGALFRTFGFGAEEAAKNSESLIQLAVDLRAATGDELTQIIDSLTSGLTGGYKAFQRYGVVVNEARIKAKALELGLVNVEVNQLAVEKATIKVTEANKKAAEALAKYGEDSLEYQKAQIAVTEAEDALTAALGGKEIALDSVAQKTAILAILNEDLAFAEGQAAKESDSYSSQLALKDTLLENLQKRIGEKLLPVFTDFVKKFNEFITSEQGQATLDAIADAFGNIAEKIKAMLEDGTIQEMVSQFIEKAPEIVTGLGNIITQLIELAPAIFDITERLLALFGIETEAEKSRQAFYDNKKAIKELAEEYDTDTDTMKLAIAAFAEENGIELSNVLQNWAYYEPSISAYMEQMKDEAEVSVGGFSLAVVDFARKNKVSLDDIYSDWSTYEPQIAGYVQSVGGEYQTKFDASIKVMSDFAKENGVDLDTVMKQWHDGNADITFQLLDFAQAHTDMKDAVVQAVESLGPEAQTAIDNAASNLNTNKWDTVWRWIKQAVKDVWDVITTLFSPGAWSNVDMGDWTTPMAAGGRAYARRPYLVGDDAQNRPELFIPDTNGTLINGDKTERIMNSINNSRTVGDIYMTVVTYGANAAEIADELGAAFQKKIRMSGAML